MRSLTWARTYSTNVAQRQHTPRKPSQIFNCKAEVLKNTKKKCIWPKFQQTINITLNREFVQSLGQSKNYKQRWKTNTRMEKECKHYHNGWELFMASSKGEVIALLENITSHLLEERLYWITRGGYIRRVVARAWEYHMVQPT